MLSLNDAPIILHDFTAGGCKVASQNAVAREQQYPGVLRGASFVPDNCIKIWIFLLHFNGM